MFSVEREERRRARRLGVNDTVIDEPIQDRLDPRATAAASQGRDSATGQRRLRPREDGEHVPIERGHERAEGLGNVHLSMVQVKLSNGKYFCHLAAISPSVGSQPPTSFGSRHCRSNGSRQANGATSWWIWLGPHEPEL